MRSQKLALPNKILIEFVLVICFFLFFIYDLHIKGILTYLTLDVMISKYEDLLF